MNTPTKNNINTSEINTLLTNPLNVQIIEALSHEELSVEEMAEMLHEDTKKISHELTLLERAHLIARHLHHSGATYALLVPQIQETIHILYSLWGNSVRSRRQYSMVHL